MTKKNVVEKNFTYYSVIKEAIELSPGQIATSAQIFDYMTQKYPSSFTESNSSTWKNNVRQLLSKCPDFVKDKKEVHSKLHYWKLNSHDRYYENENSRYSDYRINKEPRLEYQMMPKYLRKYEIPGESYQNEFSYYQENTDNTSFYEEQTNFNVNLPFFNPEVWEMHGRQSENDLEAEEKENSDKDVSEGEKDIE